MVKSSRLEICFSQSLQVVDSPLLLGLSGGPDSTALFYLFLRFELSFEVAHIDHGWREESGEEARILENLCKKKNIPFHLLRLDPREIEGNLEDGSRNRRLQFFREICDKRGLKGVALGHHADDQAEIILKRVFEGASLPKLKGMEVHSIFEGLSLFRPLLPVRKEEIVSWLNEKKISFFEDKTNEDSRFLRGRCRTEIIPLLSKSFGKEIATSLCKLSESAKELNEYLQEVIEPYQERIEEGEDALSLDLREFFPGSQFIWKAVIRNFFERKRMTLPASVLEAMIQHLKKQSAHKKIRVGKHEVTLHKGKISIANKLIKNE